MLPDPATPILIVEDFRTMVRIMRNLLKQLGFEDVDDAPDGSRALELLRQRNYGLVISDWNMAPMTGIELLRHLRAMPHHQTTPFVMVTAETRNENIVIARGAGVNAYLVKPFNGETLRGKIEEAYAVARAA